MFLRKNNDRKGMTDTLIRTNSPLTATLTDTCIECTSLFGLTAGDCECERFATASSDGECKCAGSLGYIQTNEEKCIHCDTVFNTVSYCTCADGATPDQFGACTCDSGAEMTKTNQCSDCSATGFTGAVDTNGDCDPYAVLNDDCECECTAGYSITTAEPPTCFKNDELYGIVDNGVCGSNAYPNEFGVCECQGKGSSRTKL